MNHEYIRMKRDLLISAWRAVPLSENNPDKWAFNDWTEMAGIAVPQTCEEFDQAHDFYLRVLDFMVDSPTLRDHLLPDAVEVNREVYRAFHREVFDAFKKAGGY